jgi:hypothetical protein
VYPDIDVVYYGHERSLEYDFIVHPGASPDCIRLSFDGATSVTLADNGDVLLATGLGDVRQRKPHVYQVIDGRTIDVEAAHRIDGATVAFSIGHYDRRHDLIVDPIIEWSTYFGGAVPGLWAHFPGTADDRILATSIDGESVYVAGFTQSQDFPLDDAIDDQISQTEAFVAKLVPDPATGGVSLAWSTYLGGWSGDRAHAIVARAGAAYVTGMTYSYDFPILNPFQEFNLGLQDSRTDAFVTKLVETDGTVAIEWSTFLGGSSYDQGTAIDVDALDQVYVTGFGDSIDFPTINAFQGNQPGTDVFVTKFNAFTGANLTAAFSTYLGGYGNVDMSNDIRVDSSGAVYVAGRTDSPNFPALGALQGYAGGGIDAFITKFHPRHVPTATLEWSTFLGGSDWDAAKGLAVFNGAVFVTGWTESPDFPTVNAFQTDQAGRDAFVARINQTSPLTLGWSTYYGGEHGEMAMSIDVDRSGAVYIAGVTSSIDLPHVNPTQQHGGMSDAFMARFVVSPDGSPTLAGSTYLGGQASERSFDYGVGPAIRLDAEARIYVAGITESPDFPLVNPYSTYVGAVDGFVAKLRNDPVGIHVQSSPPGLSFTASGPAGCEPGSYTTSRVLFFVPIPSTACQVTFSSTYSLGTGSRLMFRQWSDGYLPAVPQLTFDVPDFPEESLTFTALYATQHQLLTAIRPTGSGTVSPASGQFFDQNTVVTMTARANVCFRFEAWSPNAPNGIVTMSSAQKVEAAFAPDAATPLSNVTIAAGAMTTIGIGRFRQTVTLRNNGSAVTNAALVFDNLTTGFRVVNANGVTNCAAPLGSSFVNIPAPFGTQSLTVEFFRLGATMPPSYTPRVVANGQP